MTSWVFRFPDQRCTEQGLCARGSSADAPECLASCEMAFFCGNEATGGASALGTSVREEIGGVETVAQALGPAHGTLVSRRPGRDRRAIAATARIYDPAGDRPERQSTGPHTRNRRITP